MLTSLSHELHLVAREQLGKRGAVGLARLKFGERERQLDVAAHGHQAPAERQEVERAAQVLADRAADLDRSGDHAVERAVLRKPLDGGLGADLVDARDVVDGLSPTSVR